MTDNVTPTSPTLSGKVSTGYGRLDEALQGGFLAGSTVVLSAPASDEVPLLLRNFLASNHEAGLLICRSLSAAEAVAGQTSTGNVKCLVCSDKPIPPFKDMLLGKTIDNLTELSLHISETTGSLQPRRIAFDILSDILLRHKALQTRKWLTDVLTRLKTKGITTLAVINPNMHAKEEAEAVLDLFDGNLEIFEKDVEGTLRKFLRVKWMHGVEVAEKEFPVTELILGKSPAQQVAQGPTSFKEPRWLTPLVDRTEEISKIRLALDDALAQKPSVIALQGEAGVGKSRLMRELAIYAQTKGAVVLTGRAVEEKNPYGPWLELLREYIGQAPGDLLRNKLGAHISEFARLVPDIAVKVGTVQSSKPLGEEQDRLRLFEAVTQFLLSISKDAPLLILQDDIQWADQASLDLMEFFARNSIGFRILMISAYRSEDVGPDSPLYRTLMKINRERLLENVAVKNLSKEDTTKLIFQVFGERQVTTEFADLIYQRTAGNPFFVEEVLRSLVEEGTVFRTDKGWDRKPIQEFSIPESVKSILRSRLTKLGPEVISVLQVAAVVGSDFDFEVLRESLKLDADVLIQSLEKAHSAGLVVEIPNRKGIFGFADNRIRELLIDEQIHLKQARHHLKIAEAMEQVYSKSLDAHAWLLANHFAEGGDIQRGIKYSVMAGDKARSIFAREQAIGYYKRGLDLMELETREDAEKGLVLERLAECYGFAGRPGDGTRCYEQALAIFERLHDRKACARVCLGLAGTIFRTWGSVGSPVEEARMTLKRGLSYLETDPESHEAASIYSRLAEYYAIVDEWDEANPLTQKAIEIGEKTGNFAAVAEAVAHKGSFLTDTGRLDEGLPLWERSLDIALQHEEYGQAINCLWNLSIYTFPRSLTKGRETALRHIELCKRVNDIMGEARGFALLSILDWLKGDWNAALEELQKAFEFSERRGFPILFWAEAWASQFYLSTGDLERAEAYLQDALPYSGDKISVTVATHLAAALLSLEQGKVEEAREHLETCVNAFKKWEFTTFPLHHIETLLHLTSINAGRGELEEARKISERAKRLAETLKSDAGLAMASQAEASVLFASGDGKGAEEAYLECLKLWEKAGWPYYQAKALVAYSEAVTQANSDESKKRLERAAEIFRKLGAKRDLEKAQARLSQSLA